MTYTFNFQEGEDPLRAMKDFGTQWTNYFMSVQRMTADYERLQVRVEQLEKDKTRLTEALEQAKKNDEWASRVTYENVVDQIASNEDAAQRDNARRLIEPLLKKSQVTQLRKDIKRRVKELNDDGGSTFNNYGTYTEIHSGGININNR